MAARRPSAARTAEAKPEASWAEACCQLAGVAVPLAFHPFGTLGFESTKVLLLRLLALILALGWLAREGAAVGTMPGPFSWRHRLAGPAGVLLRPVVLAVALFALAVALATATSIAPRLSLLGSWDRQQGLWTTLSWVALGIAAAIAGRREDRRRGLVVLWALASLPVCLYAFVQQARLDPIAWLNQPLGVTSTLGSSTALATYLAMLVPLTLMLAVSEATREDAQLAQRQGWRALLESPRVRYGGWLALLVMQVAALAMTQVRAGLLAVGAAVLVAAMLLLWPNRRGIARALGLFAIGGLGAAVVALALLPRADVGDGADTSAYQRMLIWQDALSAISGPQALVGYGPETQMLALEPHYPVELAQRFENARFDRAHNLFLDQVLTTGLLGLAALLAVLWTVVRLGLSRMGSLEPAGRYLSIGLLGALAGWIVSNLFAFDTSATGALAWMVGGLIVAPSLPVPEPPAAPEPAPTTRRSRRRRERATPGSQSQRIRLQATAGLAALAVGLSAVPWATAPFLADLYHTRSLALRAGEAPGSSIRQELTAAQAVPWLDVPLLGLGEGFLDLARTTNLGPSASPTDFDDLFEFTPTGRDGQFEAARLALERAVALNPRDPYTHADLARHWMARAEASRDPAERADLYGRAVEAYDRAIEAGPSRVAFYDEAGVALTRWGKPDLALERFRQADALTHPTSERLARMGDARVAAGDLAGARALYERAVALDPRSAPGHAGLAALDRQAGDLTSALDHAQRAARYQMRNWLYHRDLALAYRDLGMNAEALPEARTARRLAPAWESDDLNALVGSVTPPP